MPTLTLDHTRPSPKTRFAYITDDEGNTYDVKWGRISKNTEHSIDEGAILVRNNNSLLSELDNYEVFYKGLGMLRLRKKE